MWVSRLSQPRCGDATLKQPRDSWGDRHRRHAHSRHTLALPTPCPPPPDYNQYSCRVFSCTPTYYICVALATKNNMDEYIPLHHSVQHVWEGLEGVLGGGPERSLNRKHTVTLPSSQRKPATPSHPNPRTAIVPSHPALSVINPRPLHPHNLTPLHPHTLTLHRSHPNPRIALVPTHPCPGGHPTQDRCALTS